jgi:hypothetical protein
VTDLRIGRLARALVVSCADGKWDEVRAMTDPDLVSVEISSGSALVGVEVIIARWADVRAAFPAIRAEIHAVSAGDDIAAVHVVWHATRGPAAEGQDGHNPDAGKTVILPDMVTATWNQRHCVAEVHQVGILTVLAAAAPEVLQSST